VENVRECEVVVMQRLSSALSVLLLALQVMCGTAFADDASICAEASGDEAISACTRVITSRRGNLSQAYYNRAIEYRNKGEIDRAIADYDEAIRLDPKDANAYTNRGRAYFAKGNNDRAIAEYDEAIRLDPKNKIAYNNRGSAYEAKGDNDRAIADYNVAIRLDPKYAFAYTTGAILTEKRATMIARSPISTRRSSSTPFSPRPTPTAASPTRRKATSEWRAPSSMWRWPFRRNTTTANGRTTPPVSGSLRWARSRRPRLGRPRRQQGRRRCLQLPAAASRW
jgi:tetratricopeptide (TPR) repeat protein